MNYDEMNDFDGFMKQFSSLFENSFNNKNNSNCNSNESSNNSASSEPHEQCRDIPGGFQDLHPQMFVLIGDIIGQVMSGNMPFNVQNSIGNWFELIGQVILTYSAQQQYFQNGPGRYYNRKYKNVGNPFCEQNPTPDNANDGTPSTIKTTGFNTTTNKNVNYEEEIKKLKSNINNLVCEIELLKRELQDLRKK
ncbi:hypothetical protein [Clostridium sp. Ade.TY]|uniref:hypothetical protein n=1 Tax=Clostridium sp. Ade.TY TaxID=1391647 RepID=UPI000401086B|nr:hypothetical protein [Clostridium sp. Ade.TY]